MCLNAIRSDKTQYLKDNLYTCIFAVILLVNVLSILHLVRFKDEFHIDEYYSYILSNSFSAPKITYDSSIMDTWMSGETLSKFITVQPGEAFAYSSVYHNNALDAHPPLFYFLLHTISSFFPNVFSKLFGISLNLFFFVLTQCTLFALSKKLLGKSLWAVLPCAIYGGTMIGQDTVIFIRMYAMITFFTVMLLYLHYRLLIEKKYSEILLCGAATFLGTFTHYYAAVVAFYLAAFTCAYYAYKKHFKLFIQYSITMIMSIALVFIIYPAGFTQITGSSTNNVGHEVASHFFDFSNLSNAFSDMFIQMKDAFFSGMEHIKIPVISILTVSVVFALDYRSSPVDRDTSAHTKSLFFGLFLLLFLLSMYTISHISSKFNYLRYIYHIYPIFLLLCVLAIKVLSDSFSMNAKIITAGLLSIFLINSVSLACHHTSTFLYTSKNNNYSKIVELYGDKPLVVFNKHSNAFLTVNIGLISQFDQVYITNYTSNTSMEEIISQIDSDQGVVAFILLDSSWTKGFEPKDVMNQFIDDTSLDSYSKVGKINWGNVYFAE